MVYLLNKLIKWLESIDKIQENTSFDEWYDIVKKTIGPDEEDIAEIAEVITNAHKDYFAIQNGIAPLEKREELVRSLLIREQTPQRTPEWYAQSKNIISASEVGLLLSTHKKRIQLMQTKCHNVISQQAHRPLATETILMTAFDWGIRFEPVVKQIYSIKERSTIAELGRLVHPTNPKCCASPDGLITSSDDKSRIGRLVEIKCPVSREYTKCIPEMYFHQMQLQMQCTGCTACDYIEANFISPYSRKYPHMEQFGPYLYSGNILLIQRADTRQLEYIYNEISGLGISESIAEQVKSSAQMLIRPDDVILETIPWNLMQLNVKTVFSKPGWWESTLLEIDRFWKELEEYKVSRGHKEELTKSESPVSKRNTKCLINLNHGLTNIMI